MFRRWGGGGGGGGHRCGFWTLPLYLLWRFWTKNLPKPRFCHPQKGIFYHIWTIFQSQESAVNLTKKKNPKNSTVVPMPLSSSLPSPSKHWYLHNPNSTFDFRGSSVCSRILPLDLLLHFCPYHVGNFWVNCLDNAVGGYLKCSKWTTEGIKPRKGLNKVLYGEVPPGGTTPYRFIYHFWQKRFLFSIPSIDKWNPFLLQIHCLLNTNKSQNQDAFLNFYRNASLNLLGLFTDKNNRFPNPFIYFNYYPFIYLKPDKGTRL